jgi:hypothetical protein
MSAFGFYEKDEVVDAIKTLAKYEKESGKTPRQIVESILEAQTYAMDQVLFELLENKSG